MRPETGAPRPIYVLLLGLFPATTFFAAGIRFLQPFQMIEIYLISCAATAVAIGLGVCLAGRTPRGAFVAGILLTAFFGYGHAHRLVRYVFDQYDASFDLYLFAAWVLGAGSLLAWAAHSKHDFEGLTRFLNKVAAVLLILPAITIATHLLKRNGDAARALPPLEVAEPDVARDIYYLVFDRYASARTLEHLYEFDNTPFLDALRRRGFFVREDAVANYPTTAHSLASSLNFEHLHELADRARSDSRGYPPLYEWVRRPRIKNTLRAAGYEIEHFGAPGWGPAETDPLAERSTDAPLRREIRIFLKGTLFRDAYLYLTATPECGPQRKQFERLDQIPAEPSDHPRFVYGHFLIPHPPFVYDREGRCITDAQRRARSRRDNFVGQVEYANAVILDFVDRALARAGPKPIIILQADEGPWPAGYRRAVMDFDWHNATDAEIREKVGILSALYLPEATAADFEAAATPVNTFRVVLNRYFGANLEVLLNTTYVYRGQRDLYDLMDVTDRARWPETPTVSTNRRQPVPSP